jgi:CheY-like chemotaxis protein
VLTAEDGWEGLQVAKRLGTAIQVVLTDLIMPRIGGHELGMRLKCLLPHLKIVYMTGYLEQNDDNRGLVQDEFFVQKPFSRDVLIAKLDQVLRAERAPGTKIQTAAPQVS